MRNLALLRTSHIPLPDGLPSTSSISAVTLDLDKDAAYVAVERQPADADVEVEVWRVSGAAKWENELAEVRQYHSHAWYTCVSYRTCLTSVT